MKIMIVDDDKHRAKDISLLAISNSICSQDDIHICDRTADARKLLRNNYYDILILDVVIPNGTDKPSPSNGIQFLHEIARRSEQKKSPTKIVKPGLIVGITAHEEDLVSFREQFTSYCFNIIEASPRNIYWKQQLLNALSYVQSKAIAQVANENKTTCITVHGIESRGEWQTDFQKIIEQHTTSINFEKYSYGIYPLLSFATPFARNIEVYRFKSALNYILENNERVMIFCHSFGTYVTVKALEGISKDKLKKIKFLVMAGSVLKSSYDFQWLLENSECKIINECGSRDLPLLTSKLFVLNTGMAGRVGFKGSNNSRFMNRFYNFGHSEYFLKENNFMISKWLPLFEENNNPCYIDSRVPSIFHDIILNRIIELLSMFKLLYHPVTIISAYFIFS